MWLNQQPLDDWPRAETVQLASFWLHLITELNFGTILYYTTTGSDCWIEKLLSESNLSATTLVWSNRLHMPYLKEHQDVNMLGLVCLDIDLYQPMLNALSITLNHMREVPLVIQLCIKDSRQPNELEVIRKILKQCQDLLIPNVLLLLSDFLNTRNLYAYQMFPTFRLLSQLYSARSLLYPYKLANLHGQIIRTRPDLSQPYVFMYKDRNGNEITTGMLWRLIMGFARQLNATLELSLDPATKQVSSIKNGYFKLLQHTQNGQIDVTSSIFPMTISTKNTIAMFSFPVAISSWCTMLPVERRLTPSEAIRGVFESPWMWIYISIIYSRGINGCMDGVR
ncbi:uncharacterized protein LOC115482785 [Drosophila hydei]|uniref:Uncharacterized protein LOC115482785 n=1 Tax=Drosophila hydei TaxID=7224 RepID=A0A6J2SRR2_DROHY|nr:uncharacterized protein LOC115482785 [Drosophila hydei]